MGVAHGFTCVSICQVKCVYGSQILQRIAVYAAARRDLNVQKLRREMRIKQART